MILLKCPNCGERNISDYRYGGEYNPRPQNPMTVADDEWTDFVYMRDNKVGVQKEWWYCRFGCGIWFIALRHTKTNEVVDTMMWQPAEAEAQDE